MIECDLQLTSDGHVVVFHDWTVERTTDGSGRVVELTLAELRALDAGSWRDARFAGERVPTLAELLEVTAGRAELNLELKSEHEDPHLVRATLAVLSRAGALDRVLISSFHMGLLAQVREESATAPIAILWGAPPFEEAFGWARDLGARAIHPHTAAVTPELVAAARARGLATNVWTVNAVERVVELAEMGVDGVISDHPGRLLEARARLLGA
jgi:glycerophosphoryl diester phosphodiesterase